MTSYAVRFLYIVWFNEFESKMLLSQCDDVKKNVLSRHLCRKQAKKSPNFVEEALTNLKYENFTKFQQLQSSRGYL